MTKTFEGQTPDARWLRLIEHNVHCHACTWTPFLIHLVWRYGLWSLPCLLAELSILVTWCLAKHFFCVLSFKVPAFVCLHIREKDLCNSFQTSLLVASKSLLTYRKNMEIYLLIVCTNVYRIIQKIKNKPC